MKVDPDPTFPTVKFPNPEEKGALDLAIETSDKNGCCLIVANDPDADRFALAEKKSIGFIYTIHMILGLGILLLGMKLAHFLRL